MDENTSRSMALPCITIQQLRDGGLQFGSCYEDSLLVTNRVEAIERYADKLCLTPNYLSGVVKEYTGKTATEWVNDFVIVEAKIMLKDTKLSVQEISDRLNFPDQSTFGKYFKKIVGISPKAYRDGK